MTERFRVMAIDYGTKRIGIAMSDELRMLASARGVVANDQAAIPSLIELAFKDGVRTILVGIPRTLKNTDSEMTREVRAFFEKIKSTAAERDIEVLERDERLTSVMANSIIAQSGLPKHKRQDKGLRDEEAARIVLQEYLDQNAGNKY
jgi:putative Holliday junction resolvase